MYMCMYTTAGCVYEPCNCKDQPNRLGKMVFLLRRRACTQAHLTDARSRESGMTSMLGQHVWQMYNFI